MARVPRARDIGVSSFNVGTAAQIDIGVAKEIGRAGNAIGDAVASLGGAFAEVAGRAGAAQSKQAEADYQLDWQDTDFNVWSGLEKNETSDGSSWQAAAPAYDSAFKAHRENPKYASIPPDRKLVLDRQIAGQIKNRIIGKQGAAVRYQTGQYNTLVGDINARVDATAAELGPDSPIVKSLPQTEGDSAYNEVYENRRAAIHAKIDASVGTIFSPKQAEEAKAKVDERLFQSKLEWLKQNDPDGYQNFLDEAEKAPREVKPAVPEQKMPGKRSDIQGLTPQQQQRLANVRPELVEKLGTLQSQFGRELPINSGFRDKGHNAKVGGAKGSQHIHGNAVDLDVSGLSKEERVELIRQASAQGFTGIGVYNNAIHLDLGNRRSWGPSHSSDSVPKWAQGAIAEHLSGKAQPSGLLGKEDASRVQAGQLDIGAPKNADPKAVESVVSVASGIGVNPRAISEVFHMESGWKTNTKTGSYMGISQVGPKTLAEMGVSKAEYQNMTQAEQASFYGKWLEHYKFSEKMQAAGIDLKSLPPARQAAILQAFQFAPNGKWIEKLGRGDTSSPVTGAKQARALGSTSIDDMEAYFTRRIGNAAPQQIQEAGQSQGIQVADASGRIPQSAVQEFLGKRGAQLEELSASEPDTPLSEVVSPEELEAIRAQVPEGVDLDSVTVGDAKELLAQAAPEAVQAVSQNDHVPQQAAEPEPQLGPISPGLTLSVKSKFGNIKFSSDELNKMPAATLRSLKKDFEARKKIATQQNQALADEMMKAQVNSFEKEGKPLDPRFYNNDVIDKAYPPGTPKRVAHEKRVAGLQNIAKIFEGAGDKSVEELQYEVDNLRPDQSKSSTSEDYNIQVETYDRATKKFDAIVKLRRDDPAMAVEQSKLVQEVRSKFEKGIPKSQSEKQMLIDARMTAQRQAGIPESLRSPITDREASALASDLEDTPEDQIQTRLEDLAKSVRDNYGKDYAGVVMKSVIREYVRRGEQREEMMGVVQNMMNAKEIGPMDWQRARDLNSGRAMRVINWNPDRLRRQEKLQRYEDMSDAAKKRLDEAGNWGVTDTLKRGANKFLDTARAANRWFEGPKKPAKEDVDRLRNDPAFKKAFERKYNLTPAESLLIMQGK